jgi:MoaA/NifB/PqqE/SkfB family radical SAM enzyme
MLELKDIIWELTLKCGRGCKYCGSKNVLRKENPDASTLYRIATEIGQYGVKVVTLSGGEPGELDNLELNGIIGTLQSYGVDVRVVTNGMLFKSQPKETLEKFSIIGLSINDPKDYLYPSYLPTIPYNKITMITNFGTHNIWSFDKLAEISQLFNSWQIQLTMGEYMLPAQGIDYLRRKIRGLEGVKYVLADGLQDSHKCSAGINSCGITADGDVVPCLSQRSYGHCMRVYGNLMNRSLKDIWENEFKEIRFSEKGWCDSCRNHVEYPEVKELTPTVAQIITPTDAVKIFDKAFRSTSRRERWTSSLDGCNGNVMSYGVTDWNVLSVETYDNLIHL